MSRASWYRALAAVEAPLTQLARAEKLSGDVVASADQWEVFVNRQVERWGIPINDAVRQKDVGTATVPAGSASSSQDQMSIAFEKKGDKAADLIVHWDTTRVRIPVALK